jgi:hypothetical protein
MPVSTDKYLGFVVRLTPMSRPDQTDRDPNPWIFESKSVSFEKKSYNDLPDLFAGRPCSRSDLDFDRKVCALSAPRRSKRILEVTIHEREGEELDARNFFAATLKQQVRATKFHLYPCLQTVVYQLQRASETLPEISAI